MNKTSIFAIAACCLLIAETSTQGFGGATPANPETSTQGFGGATPANPETSTQGFGGATPVPLQEMLVDYPLYGASGQIVCGSYKGNNFGTDIPFSPLFGVKEDYNLLHNLYYWTLTLPEIEDAVANIYVNDGYSDWSSSAHNGEFFSFWWTHYEATPTYNPATRLWTMDMTITLDNVTSSDPKFPSDASCEFTLGIDPVRDPSLEYGYSWAATPSNRWARCVFPFSGSAHFRIQFDSFTYQWKVLIVE